jgi:transposase
LKGIPQGRYTREFRQEAVKLVVEDKISCREAAQRLSLAPSTLAYWVKAYKDGKLGDVGKARKPLTEVEMELARNLVNQSLLQAVTTRRPEKGLLHHSDRGSQYCSREYQGLLRQFGL